MMDRPADHKERLRAIHEDVRFIGAPAGSGKTETIVLRVVRHAAVGPDLVPVERIGLATFTVAAAAEMKARVREVLEDLIRWTRNPQAPEWESSTKSASRVADLTRTVTPADIPLIGERAEQALRDLDTAPWGTLHSMCQTLIGQRIHAMALPAAPAVRDAAAGQVADQVAEAALRQYVQAPGSFDAVERVAGGPVTFRTLADEGLNRSRIGLVATTVEDSIVGQDAIRRPVGTSHADLLELYAQVVGEAIERVRTLVDDPSVLTTTSGRPVSEVLAEQFRMDPDAALRRNDYVRLLAALLCAADGPSVLGAVMAFLRTKFGRLAPLTKSATRDEQSYLGTADDVRTVFTTKTAFAKMLVEPAKGVADALMSAQHFNLVATLLLSRALELAQDAHSRRARSGELDFDDLVELAGRSLRDGGVGRADRPIDLLVVDEVQDNDPAQHALLHAFEALGVPVVVVGDVRQSIYGFRGAQPLLFEERRALHVAAQKADLSVTFRHEPSLARAFNELFSVDVPRAGVEAPHAIPFKRRERREVPAMSVQVVPGARSADEGRTLQAQATAARIRALRALGIDYGRIAVLSPSRSGWSLLRRTLNQQGIPFIVQAVDLAWDTPGARGLAAVIRYVVHRSRVDLAAALLSPWFGLDLRELAELGRDAPTRSERVQRAITMLEDLPRGGVGSADDALRSILLRIGAHQVIEHVSRSRRDLADELYGDLRFVHDEAVEYVSETGRQLRGFLDDVIETGSRGAEERTRGAGGGERLDAVRLTTIHGAKGLEYPHVVLIGTETDTRDDLVSLLWPTEPDVVLRGKLGKGWIAPDAASDTDAVERALQRRRARELDRLLYVALTRAESSVTVVTVQKKPKLRHEVGDPEPPWGPFEALTTWWSSTSGPSKTGDFLKLRLVALHEKEGGGGEVPSTLAGGAIVVGGVTPPEAPPIADAAPGLAWLAVATTPVLNLRPTRTGSSFHGAAAAPADQPLEPGDSTDLEETPPGVLSLEVKSGREFGTAVHETVWLLALRGTDPALADDSAHRIARAQCAGTPISIDEVAAAALRILRSPLLQQGRVEHEYPVLAPIDSPEGQPIIGGGIIDIAVFHDDHTEILDIKTDAVSEDSVPQLVARYAPQLQVYARALVAAGAQPVTRLGLLLTGITEGDGTARFVPIPTSM